MSYDDDLYRDVFFFTLNGEQKKRVTAQEIADGLGARIPMGIDTIAFIGHVRQFMRTLRSNIKKMYPQTENGNYILTGGDYNKIRSMYGNGISENTIDDLRKMSVPSREYHHPVSETVRSFIIQHEGGPTEVIRDVAKIYRVRIKSGVVRKIRLEGVQKKADQLRTLRQYLSIASDPDRSIYRFSNSDSTQNQNIPTKVQALVENTMIDAQRLQSDSVIKQVIRLYAGVFVKYDRVMYNGKVYTVTDNNPDPNVVTLSGIGDVPVSNVVPYEKSGRVGKVTDLHEKIITLLHTADNSLRAADVIKYMSCSSDTMHHKQLITLCAEGEFIAQRKLDTNFPYVKYSDLDFDEDKLLQENGYTTAMVSSEDFPHTLKNQNDNSLSLVVGGKEITLVQRDVRQFLLDRSIRYQDGDLTQMDISRARKSLNLTYTKMQSVASERDTPKLNTIHDLFVEHFVRSSREGVDRASYTRWVSDLKMLVTDNAIIQASQKELRSFVCVMADVFLLLSKDGIFNTDEITQLRTGDHQTLMDMFLNTTDVLPVASSSSSQIEDAIVPKGFKNLIFMDATSIYLNEGSHMGWSEAGTPAMESVKTQRGLGTKVLAAMQWPSDTCRPSTQDSLDLSYVHAKCGGKTKQQDWCYLNRSFCVDVYTPRHEKMSLFNFETFAYRVTRAEELHKGAKLEDILENIANTLKQGSVDKKDLESLRYMQTYVLVRKLSSITTATNKNVMQTEEDEDEDMFALQSLLGSSSAMRSDAAKSTDVAAMIKQDMANLKTQNRKKKRDEDSISTEYFIKVIMGMVDFGNESTRQNIDQYLTQEQAKLWIDINELESNIPFIVSKSTVLKGNGRLLAVLLQLLENQTLQLIPQLILSDFKKPFVLDVVTIDETNYNTLMNAKHDKITTKINKARDDLESLATVISKLEEEMATLETNVEDLKSRNVRQAVLNGAQTKLDDAKKRIAVNIAQKTTNAQNLEKLENALKFETAKTLPIQDYIFKVSGQNKNDKPETRYFTGDQFMNEWEFGIVDGIDVASLQNNTRLKNLLHNAKVLYFFDLKCRAYSVKYAHSKDTIYVAEEEVCRSAPFYTHMLTCEDSAPYVSHPQPGKVITFYRNAGSVTTWFETQVAEITNENISLNKTIYKYIAVGDNITESVADMLPHLSQVNYVTYANQLAPLIGIRELSKDDVDTAERVFGVHKKRKFKIEQLDTLNIRNSMNKVENITKSVYARFVIGELIWRFDLNNKFVIHDGASYFMPHNKDVYDLMKMVCGCHMVTLPAYSPEFNPIELVFATLKHRVKKADMPERDYTYLKSTIFNAFNGINTKTVKNFYYHDMYSPHKFVVDRQRQNQDKDVSMVAGYTGITRGSRVLTYATPFAIIFVKPSDIRQATDVRERRLLVIRQWESQDFVDIMKTLGLNADDFSIYRYNRLGETLSVDIIRRIHRWVIDASNQAKYSSLINKSSHPDDASIQKAIRIEFAKVRELYFLKKRRFQMRLR